jgi:hypothetical protein
MSQGLLSDWSIVRGFIKTFIEKLLNEYIAVDKLLEYADTIRRFVESTGSALLKSAVDLLLSFTDAEKINALLKSLLDVILSNLLG